MQRGAKPKLERACAAAKIPNAQWIGDRTTVCRIAALERHCRSRSRHMAKRDRQGARNARPPLAGGAKEHHRTQLGALAPSSDLPPLNSPSSIPSSLPSQCLCVGEAAGAQRDGRVANRAQAWHLSRLHRCHPSWEGTADFEIRALLLLLAHLPFCLEIFGPLTAGRALPLFSTARVGIWFGSVRVSAARFALLWCMPTRLAGKPSRRAARRVLQALSATFNAAQEPLPLLNLRECSDEPE